MSADTLRLGTEPGGAAPELAAPFVLGIDPGADTGLAGFVPPTGRRQRGRLAFVTSAGPLVALRLLTAWHREGVLLAAVVEDSRRLPVYARHADRSGRQRDRIARNVGRVDCLTDLYLDLLRSFRAADGARVPVRCVEPVRAPKWDAGTLRRLTGYEDRTNQHGRDAARLVWAAPRPR